MADDNPSELRILLLSTLAPYPATAGGNQRTNLMHRALSSVGKVDLLLIHSFGNEDEAALKAGYRLAGNVPVTNHQHNMALPLPGHLGQFVDSYQRIVRKYAPEPRAQGLLDETLKKSHYDFIVSRHLVPATASGALDSGIPVILDLDDVDHLRHASQLTALQFSLMGRLRMGAEIRYIRRQVERVSRRCVHTWLVREEDKACVPCPSLSLLPNIPFNDQHLTGEAAPPGSTSKTILFVGSFDYIVNVRGIDHFIHRVWPQIHQQTPEATLRLVGREGGNAEFSKVLPIWRTTPGVQFQGFVDDLGEAYRECAFAICPINEGAGTKIKVVEALAHGRTCVTSTHSYRGYETYLTPGESLLVAHDDAEFARQCLELLSDSAKATRLAETGFKIVRRFFVYDAFEAHVRDTIAQLLEKAN